MLNADAEAHFVWGQQLEDSMEGMEAGTLGGKSRASATYGDWVHSSALLGEGSQFRTKKERANGWRSSAFQNESCKAH